MPRTELAGLIYNALRAHAFCDPELTLIVQIVCEALTSASATSGATREVETLLGKATPAEPAPAGADLARSGAGSKPAGST